MRCLSNERKQYDVIVAIDPDCDRSGVATLIVNSKTLTVQSLSFPKLLDYFITMKGESLRKGYSLGVIVEAGWINQSNWHLSRHDNARTAAAKGNATGRNHEVGKKIVECAKHYGLSVEAIKPLRKIWSGNNRKITHEELAYFTNIEGRTSQDQRDAALLSWVYADLPVKIKK